MPAKIDNAVRAQAIQYATAHGASAAAKKFGVSRAIVYRWLGEGDTPAPVAAPKMGRPAKAPKTLTARLSAPVPAFEEPEPAVGVLKPVAKAVLTETAQNGAVSVSMDVRPSTMYKAEIPAKDPSYVPFGCHSELQDIIKAGAYGVHLIYGEPGVSKTFGVIQTAAKLGRPVVTISCGPMTEKEELLGKYALVNGATVYEHGAVSVARQQGAILLLDEVDRAKPDVMVAINMILDGYDFTNPMTGEVIKVQSGHMVFMTANTRGTGDNCDRFVTAQVLDEATLDRVHSTFEQDFPTPKVEQKILSKFSENESLTARLVAWANQTRKTYHEGGVGRYVTTRRLVMIIKNTEGYCGGDDMRAVKNALGHFDPESRDTLIKFYKAYMVNAPVETNGPVEV